MNPLLKTPSSDFASIRDGRNSLPLYIDIDLSLARSISANTQLVIEIAANSFYSDSDTSNGGNATVHFQDTNLGASSAPFFVSPGFIANVGFTKLLIENPSQPGKRLRIFYGVDIDFQAGVNASIAIAGDVTVIEPVYNGNYASVTPMAANTPSTVFSPAANVNGAIVNLATMNSYSNTAGYASLLAKASAPASVVDGDVLLICAPPSSIYYGNPFQINTKVRIPAGKGLYFISSVLETLGARSCTYRLL